jgi:phasin family protein
MKMTATSDPKNKPPQDDKSSTPDITSVLERFKLPGFDVDSFVASRKLDIDAVTRATSAGFTGAQTIVDKQAEFLKTVLTEIGDVLHTLPADAAKPAELLHKQQELVSDALSRALTSLKEIAETVSKSQSDILEIASTRLRSNIEDIRRMAKGEKPTETETEVK